jgi:hypothetical protein
LKEIPVKKIVLSALAVAAAAGVANAQTIELRWTERHGQTMIGPGATPVAGDTASGVGTVSDATLFLTLEARVVGGTTSGISTFGGDVTSTDPYNPVRNTGGNANGFFSGAADASAPGFNVANARATSTFSPNFVGPWVNGDGDPLASGRGIFNPYRQVANLGNAAQGIVDSVGETVNAARSVFGNMAQADFDANAGNNFGNQGFITLAVFRYDVTDLTARNLVFTWNGFVTAFNGYDAGGLPIEVASPEGSVSYTVSIVPAPGAAALLGLGGLIAARRRRA